MKCITLSSGKQVCFDSTSKAQDGRKNVLVQPSSRFNFPISKKRKLAEQARAQGDIATQNKVVPPTQVEKDFIAKQQIKEQQRVADHMNRMGTVGPQKDWKEIADEKVNTAIEQFKEGEIIDPTLELISTPIKSIVGASTGTYGFPSDAIWSWGARHSTDGGPLGTAAQYVQNAYSNPEIRLISDWVTLRGLGGLKNLAAETPIANSPYPIVKNSIIPSKPSWQLEEVPGLHLKSTMKGSPLEKQLSKTGEININSIKAYLGKNDVSSADKHIIDKVLNTKFQDQNKINYNDFRKAISDELIPLNKRYIKSEYSNYGLGKLGFPPVKESSVVSALTYSQNFKADLLNKININKNNPIPGSEQRIKELEQLLAETEQKILENTELLNKLPATNYTSIFENPEKFGKGSNKHYPDEPNTLGHVRTFSTPDNLDIQHVLEYQSDFFQGEGLSELEKLQNKKLTDSELFAKRSKRLDSIKTGLDISKTYLDDLENRYNNNLLDQNGYPIHESQLNQARDSYKANLQAYNSSKAELDNFDQKLFLGKDWNNRFLQEIVKDAAENDFSKIRFPTRETAAKIQDYSPYTTPMASPSDSKNAAIVEHILRYGKTNSIEEFLDKLNKESASYNTIFNENDIEYAKEMYSIFNNNSNQIRYKPKYETILKRYTDQPKSIKKLFGTEPTIITDDKRNTWYEFSIPESFKQKKGEIKAFKPGGLIKAQEGSKNTKNYQPSKDVIISGNEYSDYDKRASDLEAKYRQCHEGDLDCLGSANQFYNQYTARQAGLPTTWEMYQNRGVNSVNAWDVAALPNTTILYNFNKQGPFQNLSEEERMRIYKNIPLGATVSYMGGDTGSHRSGVESGHKKAGLPDTTHAAKVIGFSEDGFPIIFDYGKTFTLRPDILGGNLGGYTPQIVSFPNEVKDAVFENVNKPGVGRALSLDPKSVIVDPKLGAFKKTGKGKLKIFSPESLRLPIGSDAYEASKGFAKTINEFRDTAVTKLGIDPEYYDSYLAPAAFGIAGQESEFGTKGEPFAEFADKWIPGLHNKSIGPLQIDRYIVNSNDKNNKRLQSLWKEYAGINHEDDLRDPDKAMKAAMIMMNYNRYSMDRAFNQNKKQPEYGLSEPELLKLAYYYNNPSSVPVALGESNYVRNVNDMSTYLLPSEGYTIKTKEISYPKHILKAPWAPRPPYKKEKGGKNINNTGYLDNSDTKHNPYNVIPSNNITMDGVSIPLLLMPDGDKARVVMPHSGEYNFPNSQYVTEIPLAQQGLKTQVGGQAQAKKKTYPPGYHKTPPPNFNIPVSQRDSVANYAYNRATYEGNKGSNSGTGLSNYGYNESQESFNKKPARFTPPSNEQQAVDLYMKEVAPKVDYFPTAAEQTIAGDLYYNAGRDIRIYMLDQYLKSIGQTGGLPNRKDYNKDVKTDAWTPDLQSRLDAEWNKYKGEIYKLPTQKRRELMNNGRDYYYKNTYVDPEAKKPNDFSGQGVTYWSKSRQQKNPNDVFDSDSGWYYQRGPDGTLSPQYKNTWYGRQHATDLYEYVNPNAVNDPTSKYYPKRQTGGQNVKKGPGPFLIPEPRAQFKSIPVDNLADPRLRAYQDSVIQNNKSIEALQNFNKAYNTKQPYVATPENLTDDYKNSGVKQQAKYTNPKNTKNYLQPSKKIDDLNEEQRANLLEAFNTQQEGTPINLPTALYYADLFNNNTYKNEDIWFDYHTNPVQPYHLAPIEQIATKNVSPIPVNDERVLPSMNFPIPTFAGTMYTPTTEGLTIPVPTVNIVKETVPPRVNAKRRQNKVNVGSNTKTKVKFDIDQREILSREDLDSLRGSVGLDPKGYESGGKIIKLSTGKIIKIK